jgi:hypothetical protein
MQFLHESNSFKHCGKAGSIMLNYDKLGHRFC